MEPSAPPTPTVQPPAPAPPVPTPTPQSPQPPAPTPPTPPVVSGDGGLSPISPTGAGALPAASPSGGRKIPKKLIIILVSVLVVLGGLAAWYFGYYTNPTVIYKKSLENTAKGYDKLVTYVDSQSELAQDGYSGDGTYKIKVGTTSTDGKIALDSDGNNSQLAFDVGLGVTRVNVDALTIKSTGDTPDIYVKASNIKGLGTVVGSPSLDPALAKLDNSWIVIDHTLIDNIGNATTGQTQSSAMTAPTRAQVLDEAKAFGKVNQEYLFSTKKDKAVTKIVKSYGKETVDGRTMYHYKIALQPANVKQYIEAQSNALKTSDLNAWLVKNKYDKEVYKSFDQAATDTKNIKTTDTYDIWVDAGKRLVYKVRFSDKKTPATNFVDVGLNYTSGDSYPFFISGKSKDNGTTSDFAFVATLNTKTNTANFKFNLTATGEDSGTVSLNFDYKPGASNVKITKPTGAKPLSQVLSELGYGSLLTELDAASASSTALPQTGN